jgi:hypothetical protein
VGAARPDGAAARDVAGAIGVPLLLVFLWRSRNRAALRERLLVVAALELYGTAIGTWRWAPPLPGLGIPDGNPPSGVASGYVWFDVMALLARVRSSFERCELALQPRDSAAVHSRVRPRPATFDATSATRAPSRRQRSVKPRGAASVCATSSTPAREAGQLEQVVRADPGVLRERAGRRRLASVLDAEREDAAAEHVRAARRTLRRADRERPAALGDAEAVAARDVESRARTRAPRRRRPASDSSVRRAASAARRRGADCLEQLELLRELLRRAGRLERVFASAAARRARRRPPRSTLRHPEDDDASWLTGRSPRERA